MTIVNFSFGPQELTVKAGDTVMWTNGSGSSHTATASGGEWRWDVPGGATVSEPFAEAGIFSYFCVIHPTMTATITVEG